MDILLMVVVDAQVMRRKGLVCLLGRFTVVKVGM